MRRIILVESAWFCETRAFSNLEKAIEYLKKEHHVMFKHHYVYITAYLKHGEYKVKSNNGIFGEIEHTIKRINLY